MGIRRKTKTVVNGHVGAVRIVVRKADPDGDLARVAARDSQRLPDGPWAVAEVEGEALAVLSLNSGAFVADPFSRTVELRALLELRAKQLRAREGSRRGVARAARHRVARSPAGALGRAGTLAARPRA